MLFGVLFGEILRLVDVVQSYTQIDERINVECTPGAKSFLC